MTQEELNLLLTREQICHINDLCKESCDLKMGDYYKNVNIRIDLDDILPSLK